MFLNFFFLFLLLVIVNLGLESPSADWIETPLEGFGLGIFTYFITLLIIYLQNLFFRHSRVFTKTRRLALANLELLIAIALFHLLFGGHRIFFEYIAHSQILVTLFLLTLYFLGLGFFHMTASSSKHFGTRYQESIRQLRLLLPFIVPFFLLIFLIDLTRLLPETLQLNEDHWLATFLPIAVAAIFLVIGMIFLPKLIKKTWDCKPLEDSPLKDKLEHICRKSNFHHAGMLTWPVMEPSLTAAILGVNPKYRYVMFTPSLLKEFPDEEIEAILAHEIGHSKHKHLLIYPFILMGMVVCFALFTHYAGDSIIDFFFAAHQYYPSKIWEALFPFAIAIPFAIIGWAYFRIIFGYFSRLFERQADLYIYNVGMSGKTMIATLDHIGKATGNSHHHPSWHHHSLNERIEFLKSVEKNPKNIHVHNRKVAISLIMYFLTMFLILLLLFI